MDTLESDRTDAAARPEPKVQSASGDQPLKQNAAKAPEVDPTSQPENANISAPTPKAPASAQPLRSTSAPLSADSARLLLDAGEAFVLAAVFFGVGVAYIGAEPFISSGQMMGGIVITTALHTLLTQTTRRKALATVHSMDLPVRLRSLTISFLVVLVVAFLMKASSNFSRVWIGGSYLAGMLAIILWSRFRTRALQKMIDKGQIAYRTLIFGNNERSEQLVDTLSRACDHLDLRAVVDTRATRTHQLSVPSMTGVDLETLVEQVRENPVDAIIIDLPTEAVGRIREVERAFEAVNVDILLAPSVFQLALQDCAVTSFGPLPTIALYQRPIQGPGSIAKIIMDRMGALILLALFSPLMLLTALLIKLESRGPVLFRQPRTGLNNKPFQMLKFRSMRADMSDVAGKTSTQRQDKRITRIGRIIRRLSIDELPQLINVVRGDMSLVGPRPHASGSTAGERARSFDDIVQRYAARHRVLPGLTGLAQVRGFRGNTEEEEDILKRVDSDLEYIQRWSIWLDIEVLVRTALVIFWQKNAY